MASGLVDLSPEGIQARKQAAMIAALREAPQVPVEGKMVGGQYIRPHWSQQLNAVLGQIAGAYGAGQQAENEAKGQLAERQKALDYLKGGPQGHDEAVKLPFLAAPEYQGQEIGTQTVAPTQEEKLGYLERGMVEHPQLQNILDARYQRTLQEPKEEAARQAAAEQKEADRALRAQQEKDKIERDERDYQEKVRMNTATIEDRRKHEENVAKQNAILAGIQQQNAQTSRMNVESQIANRADQMKDRARKAADKPTAQMDASDAMDLLGDAEGLIKNATGSLIGDRIDKVAGAFGIATPGSIPAAQLKAIEGALIMKQPKFSGPTSDKDAALYRQMSGQIGDPTVPFEVKQAALQTVRGMQQRYGGKAGARAAALPKAAEAAAATALTTPKPGPALPLATGKGQAPAANTKVVGGKTYVNVNGQWYEQ